MQYHNLVQVVVPWLPEPQWVYVEENDPSGPTLKEITRIFSPVCWPDTDAPTERLVSEEDLERVAFWFFEDLVMAINPIVAEWQAQKLIIAKDEELKSLFRSHIDELEKSYAKTRAMLIDAQKELAGFS